MITRFPSRRRNFLLGAATAVLAASLSAPAAAQVADTRAAGTVLSVSDQARRAAPATADASHVDTHIALSAPLIDTAVRVEHGTISASARGNNADTSVVRDSDPGETAGRPTLLRAGMGGLDAQAEMLVAIHQRNIAAPVLAEAIDSRFALAAVPVARGDLALTENVVAGAATGNEAAAATDTGSSGAGIVTLQRGDATSDVVARAGGRFELSADAASESKLGLGGNRTGASATGNSANLDMKVTRPTVAALPATSIASSVPGDAEGDPTVAAAYSVLSHQIVAGDVGAEALGADGFQPFEVVILGAADASRVSADANTVLASGIGNRSATALRLDAGSIARAARSESPAGGPVAALANVQRADQADISAVTGGGAIANLLGGVTGSSYSVSQNLTRAAATANLADANLLDVRAESIDLGVGPVFAPDGTAQTGIDGNATASAAFTVQNMQDRGTGTVAAVSNLAVATLQASGIVDRSTLRADGNSQLLSATGNEATSTLKLQATTLRATADLNNVQAGDGDVHATAGLIDDPAGAILAPTGSLRDSSFSVSGNATLGSAVANLATNSLTVDAAKITNGSGHGDAVAGPLPFGYGAAADFALASHQKVGEPAGSEGEALTRIESAVIGRFAISGDGDAERSTFNVDGNRQAATALGNSVVNRLSLSAVMDGGEGSPAAGSALSSAQYGQADVDALSRVRLAVRGSAVDSRMSMSGNANQALGVMNDADNRLSVDTGLAGDLTRTDTRVAISTSSGIAGDHVLGNLQFASGSVRSRAATWLLSGDYGQGLTGSQLAIEDNASSAEASANRAINRVDMSLASGAPVTGIGSMQMSTARVEAVAGIKVGYAADPASSTTRPALSASGNLTEALARGNVADNRVALAGLAADPEYSAPRVEVGSFGMKMRAPVALLNAQTNHGSITATATGVHDLPLNAGAPTVSAATLRLADNRVAAAAYGNAASNAIAMQDAVRPNGAAISNVQLNTGPVTAVASGSGFAVGGPALGNLLAITGNQVVATATGNHSTSILSMPR